jgi:hypothetical protein
MLHAAIFATGGGFGSIPSNANGEAYGRPMRVTGGERLFN